MASDSSPQAPHQWTNPFIFNPTIKLITVLSLTVFDPLILNQHECHTHVFMLICLPKTYHLHR